MKPEIKTEWLEALSSGEYPKGVNSLAYANPIDETPMQFCCLGVLCEIAVKHGVDIKVDENNNGFVTKRWYDDSSAFLPTKVAEWAGIVPETDEDERDPQSQLANINDDADSFAPVIAYIEENL